MWLAQTLVPICQDYVHWEPETMKIMSDIILADRDQLLREIIEFAVAIPSL